MATLDWSQCPAVESVPDRLSGAWVFKDTRMPVSAIFENLEAGSDIDEIIEQFHLTREQIQAVLEFAARSLDAPPLSGRRHVRRNGCAYSLTTMSRAAPRVRYQGMMWRRRWRWMGQNLERCPSRSCRDSGVRRVGHR